MIAYLNGRLLANYGQRLVVDVNGVGYELQIPASTQERLPSIGGALALEVHTHVREDAILLFGFATRREKVLFERLLSVNGVGPKLALAILSGLPAEALTAAIRAGDLARLSAIGGVGKKTAERVVLELKDKLEPGEASLAQAGGPDTDVVSALVNLGYAPAMAEKVVAQVGARVPRAGFEDLLTECLRRIGR